MATPAAVKDIFVTPDVLANPYDYYDKLRENAPVYFSKLLNGYLITSYELCKQVLMNSESFSSDPNSPSLADTRFLVWDRRWEYLYKEAGVSMPVPTPPMIDLPDTRRYRRLVEAALSATSVRKMDEAIASVVDELIGGFINNTDGKADLYREFCLKLPLYIINEVLGLPRSAAEVQALGAEATVRLAGAHMESEESVVALHKAQIKVITTLKPFVDRYRAAPEENLLSHLLHVQVEGEAKLNDAELYSIIWMLNVGGNETTTNGLGNSLYELLTNPEMQGRLRADPQLIPGFIEEAIRIHTPVAGLFRWALKDADVGGVTIPKGSLLQVRLAAGNRDSSIYGCPAKADLSRDKRNTHLAFGQGIHFCVGSKLARSEMQKALAALLARTSILALDSDEPAPQFAIKIPVRGVDRLPVKFTKAA